MFIVALPKTFFIPHYAEYQQADGDYIIREVFDASIKCLKEISLSDCLLQEPKLQKDIANVFTHFWL